MLRGVYLPDWIEKPKTDVIVALEFLAGRLDELQEELKKLKASEKAVDPPVWVVWKDNKCPTCGRKKKKNG